MHVHSLHVSLHWQAHQFNQQTSHEEVVLWGEHPYSCLQMHTGPGLTVVYSIIFCNGISAVWKANWRSLSRLHLSAQAAGSAENNAGIWGERTCECASIPVQEDQQHLQGQKR